MTITKQKFSLSISSVYGDNEYYKQENDLWKSIAKRVLNYITG